MTGSMNIGEFLKQLIYPSVCIVCGDYTNETLVCHNCRGIIEYVREPKCMKCGKHMENSAEEYCEDCKKVTHLYDSGFGAFVYNEYLRKSIYDFKYHGVRSLGKLYGSAIADGFGKEIMSWKADCIMPVPLHREKLRKRGYNQAEVLADALGKEINIPVLKNVLIRSRATAPQKELSNLIRKKNVENAFIISKNVVKLRKVILIDDIYTTGATIDECSKALRSIGCEKIYYISLCIGAGI